MKDNGFIVLEAIALKQETELVKAAMLFEVQQLRSYFQTWSVSDKHFGLIHYDSDEEMLPGCQGFKQRVQLRSCKEGDSGNVGQ
ncbi:hypothetical protein ASF12_30940 [Paenibacillus sp. Leaf72]|nr:hypothetical protein ASF12_30940 [Paenibacillus sp. Leaf72]